MVSSMRKALTQFFRLFHVRGVWYDINTVFGSVFFQIAPKSIDYLIIPFTFNKYIFKFKAPNQASTEKLSVTFTDNSGITSYDELLVDVQ